ncbi:hypothetical protein BofuT4_P113400.1 [Botrytis cinerea T4]|uniref:Uncharacterized protein n=1 Tax=Botryotinia fuckeliana (strain T4) TaxID=999810 RepID=G2Y596_BOTF4|nr:hypothetical protein BofuT4_P113400.1 [Botrytis cinerea T4]
MNGQYNEIEWSDAVWREPLTDPVRTATSKHETKAKQKEYFKVYCSAYKHIMTRKDQDRLKENTRVYRAALSADGEKKKKHLTKHKQLRSYWSEEKKKEEKKKRELRDQQPGIKEAQNKRIRERRANDPEYREKDNRRRRI